MSFPYKCIKKALFCIDAEKAHNLTLKAMKSGLSPKAPQFIDKSLTQTLWGLDFPNPVGLAAGFDKNAEVITAALKMGFGFVEAGTVTPKPQEGNPKPRVFRSPSNNAVINRMGFPNAGYSAFKENAANQLKSNNIGVIGINIGMNKDQTEPEKDYRLLICELGPMADYLTINVSSPNTPGLRDLQSKENLLKLSEEVLEEREKSCGDKRPPILIKLAPDLNEDQQEEIATAIMQTEIDGLILTNTTLDRPENLNDIEFSQQAGGLSGQPLTGKSTNVIRNFYQLLDGSIPIIGAGGIASGEQAYEKIKAGASLIQIYSGMIYEGPSLIPSINKRIVQLLKEDGLNNISDAIGIDNKNPQPNQKDSKIN